MENFMRARISERLDALGLTPFQAAKAAGLNRYIVFDLIEGKKETIRQKALVQLAAILDCDPEYLIGAQATPRRVAGAAEAVPADAELPLIGICEPEVWRKPGAVALPDNLPVQPDRRYPAADQVALLARGSGAEALGINDGDVLVLLTGGPVRDGDVVVARRKARGGVELSARRVKGTSLTSGSAKFPDVDLNKTEVLGRVILAHRVF